jgi:hypothetical protein
MELVEFEEKLSRLQAEVLSSSYSANFAESKGGTEVLLHDEKQGHNARREPRIKATTCENRRSHHQSSRSREIAFTKDCMILLSLY